MSFKTSDTALVFYYPLNESSGTPIFKNYASITANQFGNMRSSGITLDLVPHIVDSDANSESTWPGNETFLIPSGTVSGLMVLGRGLFATTSYTNYVWLVGGGNEVARRAVTTPGIANSGFTIGGWIYPNSSGMSHQADTGANQAGLSMRHALISRIKSTAATPSYSTGFIVGVSGQLEFGAQAAQPDPNNFDRTLMLFAHVGNATAGNHRHLQTAIESGRFTHFTFVYTYTNAGSQTFDLYKDGVLAATTTGDGDLDLSSSNFSERALSIGGTERIDSANAAFDYTFAAGHRHVVSGLYFFERPFIAADVTELHGGGGITVDTFSKSSGTALLVTDQSLLGYYEFNGKGGTDSSLKSNHLIIDEDSINAKLVSISGPFGKHGYWNDGSSTLNPLIAPSSLTMNLRNSPWTIAGWFFINDPTTAASHIWSLGTESNATLRFASLDYQTAGKVPRFTIYRDGTTAGTVVRLIPSGQGNGFNRSWFHAACIYDHRPDTELPYNAFLYINGELSASGNLGSALATTAIDNGLPLVILGANSTSSIAFDATKGDGNGCAQIAIFNRPLNQFEVRGLALSGINTDSIIFTPHDPRLRAYWRCNEPSGAPLILDYASYGGSGNQTALRSHLVPYINSNTIDLSFGNTVTATTSNRALEFLNILIDSEGKGITSGVFVPMGGTVGTNQSSVPAGRDSASSLSRRFNNNQDGKTIREPPPDHDFALYFQLTPSGEVPRTFFGRAPNSALFSYGADTGVSTTNDGWSLFLTDVNKGPSSTSGTAIVFQTKATLTTYFPLVSGNVTTGNTNKILIRTKTFHDGRTTDDDNNIVEVDLWIDGVLIQRQQYDQNTFALSPNTPSNLYKLMIGANSSPLGAAPVLDSKQHGGLGGIFLKEIAFLMGSLSDRETQILANKGITMNAGLSTPESRIPMTRVSNADANLEGYWRFSDPTGSNSGLDLSIKGNNLQTFRPAPASSQNSLNQLKVVRGPFRGYTNYPIEASGIGYPANTTSISFPPFVVSGVGMQNPQNSFSVGIRVITNTSSPNTNAGIILCYGPYPRTNSIPQDASWSIGTQNTLDNVYLNLSLDGAVVDTSSIATSSGQVCVGTNCKHGTEIGYPLGRFGYTESAAFQGLNQYTFTYNSNTKVAKAYLNGEIVDQQILLALHNPTIPENKFISFLVPATGQPSPWTWGNSAKSATDLVLNETFYFSRVLDDSEVRYIAASGISKATTTSTSGVIGGWLQGLGISSGVAGGYTIGFIPQASGVAGGYILGLGQASGIAGGYIYANAVASGIVGGWTKSVGMSSGVCGGLTYGALSGTGQFDAWFWIQGRSSSDFNALIELNRSSYADFNSQIELYQPELPAMTVIKYPPVHQSGVIAPFVEWFVGSGVPVQGKTLTKVTYDFGDFTPTVNATPSSNFQYVYTHRFPLSGIYNVLFKTIDSDGLTGSDFRIINLASGVPMPTVTLTATPTDGYVPLTVNFTTTVTNLPPGVSIVSQLLDFGNNISTIRSNPSYVYTVPGNYIPRFMVLDSRGFVTSDSLLIGANY